MKRIGFIVLGTDKWIGGRHYITNLLKIIKSQQSRELSPILFLPSKVSKVELDQYLIIKDLKIIKTVFLDNFFSKIGFFLALLFGQDIFIQKLLVDHKVDRVFTNTKYLGWRFALPVIVWIPDLQHKFLRYMFSKFGFIKREIGFRLQILMAHKVMLSSNDAKNHCEKFYKQSVGKSLSVPFAILNSNDIKEHTNSNIHQKYNIPKEYFYIPNQFWRHKNHILVLKAVSILKKRDIKCNIIFTGELRDNRNTRYYDEFNSYIQALEVTNQIYVLGKVPYVDVVSLMLSSKAIINPSLFEGWSTTVEEAKSLGKKLLLSDINVHFEQLGKSAIYFKKNCPDSLADQIEGFLNKKYIKQSIEDLTRLNQQKVFEFSEKFKNTMLS